MLGNRNSQHSFAQIPSVNMSRSQFDRSFAVKDTMYFDVLHPIFIDEILPGDTCNVSLNHFARLATQKVPIMDNLYIDFYFFFVPNRLVWDNWEKFNGAQDDPGDSTDFLIPIIEMNGTTNQVGSIYDKMGIPTEIADLEINALPFRAYNLIWNSWFRSQDLQNSLTVLKDNGPDPIGGYILQKSAKAHDYFTSCLPEPQKGPAVDIPLGTTAPVLRTSNAPANLYKQAGTNTDVTNAAASFTSGILNNAAQNSSFDPNGGLYTDLSTATGATINQLREAFSIQSIYELDARGGTRYVEILLAHFNVISPDFRLQRPEYLGGGRSKINVHPVPQTAPTSGANAQAQLAAFGTSSSSGSSIGFTKSFVEHGYVIGLARPRADITYQQGLNRMWSRQTRFDFFWPKLQEIGEQAVLYREIYAQGTVDDEGVFGYQERYAEYRYKPSEIRGEFRSSFTTSLDMWHMAEEFGTKPELNDAFIKSNTPIERAITITNSPPLLFDAWFQYTHARPMLTYSVPSTLGRF